MNLKELIDSNYKVFSRMSDENRDKHVEAVKYIDLLANTTQTDVSNWDITEIFGAGKGNTLVTDRNEINKRFFEYYGKLASTTPPVKGTIEERTQKRINDLTAAAIARQLNTLQTQRDAFLRNAKTHYAQYEEQMKNAWEQTLALQAHAREPLNIANQVAAIIAENFWDRPVVEGNSLYLVTKNNVIMTYRKQQAGIDIRCDLGKFAVKLRLDTMNLTVIPFENNLNLQGFIHPYISDQGQVCWGNAKSTAQTYLNSGQVNNIMRLLASLLTTFVEGTQPYRPLEGFVGADVRKIDPQDRKTHPAMLTQERAEREQQLQQERQYQETLKQQEAQAS